VIILEVDEWYHRGNTPECEVERMESLHKQIGRPVTFVRFNPDGDSCWELLVTVLEDCVDDPGDDPTGITVHYLGYPETRVSTLKDVLLEEERLAFSTLV